MTFKNNLTISVQWNAGNYCDNRWKYKTDYGTVSLDEQEEVGGYAPQDNNTAEVAVMYNGIFCTGFFANCQLFDVAGYQTAEEVLKIMTAVEAASVGLIEVIVAEHKKYMDDLHGCE